MTGGAAAGALLGEYLLVYGTKKLAMDKSKTLIRCFVWVVSELGHGWDSEFELTGTVVGGGSEVDEILESSSHPLG